MPDTVLIADDDVELCELLQEYLRGEGFHVRLAHDGEAALGMALQGRADVLVLDVMMPRLGGLDVLRRLRRESTLPVLMLTARGEDLDRILGLELGADDYLPKPCNPRELLARLRAVLRRSSGTTTPGVLCVDDLELHPGSRRLLQAGSPVSVTSTEFSVLQSLMRRPGKVISRRDLYLEALGREPVPYDRTIDMHISNLRRKLGPAHGGGERIQTVRGVGYLYAAPDGSA